MASGWTLDEISTDLVAFLRDTGGFDVNVQSWLPSEASSSNTAASAASPAVA